MNLYCYCLNNPISYCDPSGHFVITIGSIIIAALITSDNWRHYIGVTLGGAIAGFGIGICGALGAAIGATAAGAATLGFTLSGGAALGIGLSSAATAGALGYMSMVAISDKEQFDWSDLLKRE